MDEPTHLQTAGTRIQAATEVVPGMDGQKMSKSYGNTIEIFGDEKETRKRVMSIVTDSTPVEAPKDPRRLTIFQLFSLVASNGEVAEMRERFQQRREAATANSRSNCSEDCGNFLPRCENAARKFWLNPSYIDEVLARGAERANAIANRVMSTGPCSALASYRLDQVAAPMAPAGW